MAEIIKVFIASPSDTSEERAACDQVVSSINSSYGDVLGVRVETLKWERDVSPGFSDHPQSVINEVVSGKYHLFIGIMRNKFGQPTRVAGSGTEEEFNVAYSKYKEDGDVAIQFYFGSIPVDPTTLDPRQLSKVKEFKKRISDLGGMYGTYESLDSFKESLRSGIESFVLNKYGEKSNDPGLVSRSQMAHGKALHDCVARQLSNRLNESMSVFSSTSVVWVDPVLSKSNTISQNSGDNFDCRIDYLSLIKSGDSFLIKSPPQFGKTCLAHKIILEAWGNGELWVYVDAKKTLRRNAEKIISKELLSLGVDDFEVAGVVVDSWVSNRPGAKKFLKDLCRQVPEKPVVVMESIEDTTFGEVEESESIGREFSVLNLLAMPRHQLRKIVSNYNYVKNIGEDDSVLERIVRDLDALNIHRTPLNCITLLKACEAGFEESPANRTKMIELVLFALFNLEEYSVYSSRPDVKDCEYVLGRFCEDMIRADCFYFRKEFFVRSLEEYCDEKLLQLEVSLVFDILFNNNILVMSEGEFTFRSSYWIYYFAATRMYMDESFKDFILEDQGFVSFPDIVEFYTGIDRSRKDVIDILAEDLRKACDTVEEKTGFAVIGNPLDSALWQPTEESLLEMRKIIDDEVSKSNLPEEVKDRHADKSYNQLRPYDQSVQRIMNEFALTALIKKTRAAARALRNSDYVDPEVKKGVFSLIMRSWKDVSNILFALAPLLAERGEASFEGQNFILEGDFGESMEEKISAIFFANPLNVVNLFKYDLYSRKMGPLIYSMLKCEKDPYLRHSLALLVIFERPENWRRAVEEYIASVSKNSFYLFDIVNAISGVYRFDFATSREQEEMKRLIMTGFAKHEFGVAKPAAHDIKRISPSVIPSREVGLD